MADLDKESTTEVLYNARYGGFSFSEEAAREYCRITRTEFDIHFRGWDIPRTDPTMIEVVKRLGERANGTYADLKIAKIPTKYAKHFYIGEYDGYESVQINYKRHKLDSIRAALGAHEGQDAQGLKEKIEAILAETDDEEDEEDD